MPRKVCYATIVFLTKWTITSKKQRLLFLNEKVRGALRNTLVS